jgi:hypothetical protein
MWKYIISFLGIISILLVAVILLSLSSGSPSVFSVVSKVIDFAYNDFLGRVVCSGIGSVLIGILLIGTALWLRGFFYKESLELESALGKVDISYEAIEDFISGLCGKLEKFREVRVKINRQTGELKIRGKVLLEEADNVGELTKEAQRIVREGLKRFLGENRVNINFRIEGIKIKEQTPVS